METTARLKNGSTSSQHTWAYKTMTTHHYYKQQRLPMQSWPKHNYEEQQQQLRMVNDMFASAPTWGTSSSTQQLGQQQQSADNTSTQLALKCTDNFAYDSQYHLAQDQLDTLHDYSNQNSTTTISRSHSQHGNLSSNALSVTMDNNCQMQ